MEQKHGIIKFFKSLFLYIIYIIIIIVILYDMFLIIGTVINPDETPDVLGIKTFSIISGSMEPAISINDIVVVREVNPNDININDIITFKVENEIITHRVINIEKKDERIVYTTKGDKNDVTDIEKISDTQIEGKCVAKIPKIGKLLTIVKNKVFFGIIITVLLICFLWQRKILKNKIRRREKRQKYEEKQEKQV